MRADVARYTFDAVRAALTKHWGLSLDRGGAEEADGKHDGRWDVTHSRTGFIVGGQFPRGGFGHRRYRSLSDVVRIYDLAKVIAEKAERLR